MDQQCVQTRCFLGQDRRRPGIDRVGQVGLAFGSVDCRVTGCINDDLRLASTHRRSERIAISEVERGTIAGGELSVGGKEAGKLQAELARGPGEQYRRRLQG
jgi:hypothetical protein